MARLNKITIALVLLTAGCGDQLPVQPLRVPAPKFWQTYLWAEPKTLTLPELDAVDLTIVDQYGQWAALYDRTQDKWQKYALPKGGTAIVDGRLLWWLRQGDKSHYVDMDTHKRIDFDHLPASLFDRPYQPVDQAVVPWACCAAGRCWSWLENEKLYSVFDPAKEKWNALPNGEQLPPGRSIVAVSNKDGKITLRLSPRVYCTMMSIPTEGESWRYDPAAQKWEKLASIAPIGYNIVPMSGGWWAVDRNGYGQWHSEDGKIPAGENTGYAVTIADGRLWGWTKDQCFVEVTSVNPKTGCSSIPIIQGGFKDQAAFDGTYLWISDGTWITRYRPGDVRKMEYSMGEGLTHQAFGIYVTERALWFFENCYIGPSRHDKIAGRWTHFNWRKAGLPEIYAFAGMNCYPDQSFFLMCDGTGNVIGHPFTVVGIARYDEASGQLTYWSAEKILAGDWPYGPAPGPIDRPRTPSDLPGLRVRAAYDKLIAALPPQPNKPGSDDPRTAEGLQVLKLPYNNDGWAWFDGPWVYANVDKVFCRAARTDLLKAISLK